MDDLVRRDIVLGKRKARRHRECGTERHRCDAGNSEKAGHGSILAVAPDWMHGRWTRFDFENVIQVTLRRFAKEKARAAKSAMAFR